MFGCYKCFSTLVFITFCLCVTETGRIKRVIGGNEVICGTQPRVASLRNSTTNQHLCGATLLSPRFALTAAHCVSHNAEQYTLYLNNYCLTDEVPKLEVLEIFVNELYDIYSRAHDIALIRIKNELADTTWLESTVLPKLSLGLSGECKIFGYGYKHPYVEETSEILSVGIMSVLSLDDCMRRLGPYTAPGPQSGMMCALGAGVDACLGDSGGPLMCNGLVEAVSSYGVSCGVPGLPGVFTSVGAHLQWINKIINGT